MKLNDWFEIPDKEYMWYILQGYDIIDEEGEAVIWCLNGRPHREDGPAYIGATGTRQWWINNQPHRTDGPAIEGDSGSEWWVNGKRHRTDGPAVDWSNDTREWYLNGKEMTESEFNKRITNENKRNTVD